MTLSVWQSMLQFAQACEETWVGGQGGAWLTRVDKGRASANMDLFSYKNVAVDGLIADSRTRGIRCQVLHPLPGLHSPPHETTLAQKQLSLFSKCTGAACKTAVWADAIHCFGYVCICARRGPVSVILPHAAVPGCGCPLMTFVRTNAEVQQSMESSRSAASALHHVCHGGTQRY